MVFSEEHDVPWCASNASLDVTTSLMCEETLGLVSNTNVRPNSCPVVYDQDLLDDFSFSTFGCDLSPLRFRVSEMSRLNLSSKSHLVDDVPSLFLGEYSYHLDSSNLCVALAMLWSCWFCPPAPFVSGEASNPGPVVPTPNSSPNRPMAGQGKKKKRKNRRKAGTVASRVLSGPSGSISALPAAIGYVQSSNTFSISQLVQRSADQDWKNGVRCAGSALLANGVCSFNNTGAAVTFTGGLANATAGKGYVYLAPNEIDPRLAALVSCYQYYAFRRLCLKYVSAVGTSNNGTVFLGISKDPEEAVALYANVNGTTGSPTAGTIQDIMDTDPSTASTIWQPSVVEFVHRGVKLWETFANSEEPIVSRLQAAIICILQGAFPTASSSTLYGNLYLEYEIDLYVPGPPLSVN